MNDKCREALVQPAECNDDDSPWLVCKPCVAAGKCAKALTDAQIVDWIECRAMNGQIQIARSIMGTGYEVAVIERNGPTSVNVYSGTLRSAIERAIRSKA